MSRLSRLALSKRSVTLLFAAALFIAGASAWGSLKQELLPDIDFPVITVVTPYPGAGSSDVTEQVTKPIENAISGVPRLETIQSTSSNSISLVVAQFSFGTDVKATTQAIDRGDRQGQPARVRPADRPGAQHQRLAGGHLVDRRDRVGRPRRRSREIARTEIVPEILGIEGVARADVTGGLEERVFITLDPAKMAAATITSQQIVGVLQANNLTLPSGQLPADGSKVPVSTIGELTSESTRSAASSSASSEPPVVPAPAAPAAPAGSAAPSPVRASRPPPRRSRRSRSRSATSARSSTDARRDDRLRPDQRQPGADR